LGISRSTAFEHIAELRKKGLLRASPGRARSLQPTSRAQKLLSSIQTGSSPHQAPQTPWGNAHGTSIPMAGVVAAGSPLQAVENNDRISLESYFGIDEDTFALQVRGDSMIDDDIHDGDYVVCRRHCTAENGQLVVAIVDNENATLKRFHREGRRVRLEPANDRYEPIYSENCRIEAVVMGLIRKL